MHKLNTSSSFKFHLLMALMVIFVTGFSTPAEAKLCPAAPDDGFAVDIVFCTQAVIADALNGGDSSGYDLASRGYLPTLLLTAPTATLFTSYLWCMILIALTFFGTKLAALGTDELLKESAGLLFRIVMVLFLWYWLANPAGTPYAGFTDSLYNVLCNVLDELIGWIGTAFNFGVVHCSDKVPTVNGSTAPYQVWANFDCIFYEMLNISKPNTPTAEAGLVTGAVALILAALFCAPVGIAILMAGITIFISILLTLARAIYTLVLSYLVLALLVVIGPVVVPMFVLNTHFTKEVFWKWVGMICSTIFQPIFVVGFLSFFVLGLYQFVDGNFPCQNFDTLGPNAVCSFQQIITYCNTPHTVNGDKYTHCIAMLPLWNPTFNVSWNTQCIEGGILDLVLAGLIITLVTIVTGGLGDIVLGAVGATVVAGALTAACLLHLPYIGDVAEFSGALVNDVLKAILDMIARTPHLQTSVIMQFFTTLMAFLVFIIVMRHLMEVIPHMSRQMTMSVGLGILKLAQVPFENTIANALKGAGDQMKFAATEKGLKDPRGMKGAANRATGVTGAKNVARMPGIVASGAKGGAMAAIRSIIK